MIVDGSYGEGGGQILRTAVALSCITGRKITVEKIRMGRKIPGLKPQHLAAIRLASRICSAETEGLHVGATTIKFNPGEISPGEYEVDIGTAGSITLLLQTIIPIALSTDTEFTLKITGGTDVRFAPLIDYYIHVLFPILRAHGSEIEAKVVQRGYYPEGGGTVVLIAARGTPDAILIENRGNFKGYHAWYSSRNLPGHIENRIKDVLQKHGIKDFHSDSENGGRSTGCGLLAVAEYENTVLGADTLCRKGVRAEKIAEETVRALKKELSMESTVDVHMADHLPVFAFTHGHVKYRPAALTAHARTNLWLVEKFGAQVKNREYVNVKV